MESEAADDSDDAALGDAASDAGPVPGTAGTPEETSMILFRFIDPVEGAQAHARQPPAAAVA